MEDFPVLFTTEEAAKLIRKKANTLEIWRITGKYPELKHTKVGGRIYYTKADLLKFVQFGNDRKIIRRKPRKNNRRKAA